MALNIQQSIFTELADFLVSQPSLEAIAAYQVSAGVQQYIDDLLEKIVKVGYRRMNGWNWKRSWRYLM
jgi:hypothetical protein